MKKYLLQILTIFIALLSAQYVMADKANADIVTPDTNNHYLTIDYNKYGITDKTIRIDGDWFSPSKTIHNAYNLDDSNLDITFNYPCYKIDFKISTTWYATWGSAEISIDETYNDNETWDDVKSIFSESGIKGIDQTKSTDKISHTDKIAKKIAIKKEGGNSSGKYVHDIKLYIAPHILFSSATTFNFEETKIGECKSYHTIEFHSFLSEGELIIEKPTNFTIISINGQTPIESNDGYRIATNNTLKRLNETNENQKYSIVIGFKPTKEGDISETINIKDTKNTKNTKPITLIGKGFNKQPQIITWNQSLTSLEVGKTITLEATVSSGLPITYTSSNSSIISINGNQLTAKANGTATITATVAGNDLYAPTTLEKYAKVGNSNIGNCPETITLASNNGGTEKTHTYTFENLPQIKNKIITFDYTINKRSYRTNNVEFEVTNNRDNTKLTHSDSKYNETKTGSKSFTFEKEDITKLTLKGTSDTNNGLTISNIRIELKPTLYTNLTDAITFPQTPVDESASKPLKISFAQLKDNIDISISGTDANHFSINKGYISAGCGKWGIETINIYFSPNSYKEGNYNATLVIKSEGQTNIEIPLVGSTIYRETTFNKDGDWDNPANWIGGIPTGTGKNATIDAAVTIPNEYSAIANNITITHNGSITITPQGKLKANNIIGSNGTNITLQADENGSAILLFKNDENNKVNAIVQLYSKASSDGLRNGQAGNFKDPKWQYLGITAEEIKFTDINPDGTSNWIYRWDEQGNATSCWAEKLKTGSILSAWTGYCLAQESASTYTYSGNLVNGNHTYPLTYTSSENSSDDLGNNLITNSYTAPIDITTLSDANFHNTEANLYIYNTGSYLEWKELTSTEGFGPGQIVVIPANVVSNLDNEYPRTISSGQAFFVKAKNNEATFNINYEENIYNSARKENIMRAKKLAETSNNFNTLKIQITSSTSNDRLYLIEHENTTDYFDNGYDAEKIFDNPNGPQIYATTPFGYASISTNSSFDGQTIGFVANNENEIYTMTFNTEKLHSYDELYIYDTETEIYIDILNEETYQFYASTTPNDKRFYITSNKSNTPGSDTPTNIEKTTWDDIVNENQPIYIYSITGQLIGEYQTIANFKSQIINYPIGIYTIKSGNKTLKITTKKN